MESRSLPLSYIFTAFLCACSQPYSLFSSGQIAGRQNSSSDQPTLGVLPPQDVVDPGLFESVAVAPYGTHSCAITAAKNTYCWGDDRYGPVGDGEKHRGSFKWDYTAFQPSRVKLPPGIQFIQMSLANSASYAIGSDGYIYGWGIQEHISGPSGPVNPRFSEFPERLFSEGDKKFTHIASSSYVSVARTQSGIWGSWSVLEGANPLVDFVGPPGKQIVEVSGEENNSGVRCLLTAEGEIYCSKYQLTGFVFSQLGSGLVPYNGGWSRVKHPPGVKFTQISSTSDYVECALSSDSAVYCWGWAENRGGIGASSPVPLEPGCISADGNYYYCPVKVDFPPAVKIVKVGVGYGFACALSESKRVYCWGMGSNGYLGHQDFEPGAPNFGGVAPTPVEVAIPPSERVRNLSVGNVHSCVVTESNKIYCWGDNTRGACGLDPRTTASMLWNVYRPHQVRLNP